MGKAQKSEDARRRLSELIAQYRLHPEFRDVYVEGSWDKSLVEWFLRVSGVNDVVVYDVDTIDIPSGMLAKHGFDDAQHGKKQRVVTLAYELQDHVPDEQVSCLADRDYDGLLGHDYLSPLLLVTDFSCQEMYFMNEPVMAKFLGLVVGCPMPPKDFLQNLFEILPELYLLRATNLSLGWGLKWLPPGRSCAMEGNVLRFRADEFLDKYLNKGARLAEKSLFVGERDRLRQRMGDDPRQYASKDDLFMLLTEILPKFCKESAMHRTDFVARSLSGCIERQYLAAQPMYASLLSRLRAPAS